MRLAALVLVMALCGTAFAAPAPFLDSSVSEAVLETGSKERTDALLRWLKAPDLAQSVLPGQSALPTPFVAKLQALPQDGLRQVVLKLQGGARPEERALFQKLVGRVTTAVRDPRQSLAVTAEAQLKRQVIFNRIAVRRGMARGGVRLGDELESKAFVQQLHDQ